MRQDPNRYYPPGYCGTYSLIERAYFHLFPKPPQDSELIEASLKYMDFEDEITRNNRRLDAPSLPKDIGQRLRREIGNLVTEIALCRFVERAMTDRLFNPVLSLFPPFTEFEFVNFPLAGHEYVTAGTSTKPDWLEHQTPPWHIAEIGQSRFLQVTNLLRDKLFAGDLSCTLSHQTTGLFELEESGLWLDVATSNALFLSGELQIEGSDIVYNAMFRENEVKRVFSPAKPDRSEPKKSKGGRKNLLNPAIDALRKLHPNGRPNVPVKTLRKQVEDEIGREVGTSTMTKAIAAAWKSQHNSHE